MPPHFTGQETEAEEPGRKCQVIALLSLSQLLYVPRRSHEDGDNADGSLGFGRNKQADEEPSLETPASPWLRGWPLWSEAEYQAPLQMPCELAHFTACLSPCPGWKTGGLGSQARPSKGHSIQWDPQLAITP